MRIGLIALVIAGCGAALSGCYAPKAAWEYYDECATQNLGFVQMAACGKQKRTTTCEANHSCAPEGDAVVTYADSLAQAVSRHEITEAEAHRKWIAFRGGR